MRPRPPVRCLVGKPGADGVAEEIVLASVEHAMDLFLQGWWIVGPDPHDEIELDKWIKKAEWHSHCDPGDEDGHDR